ncbi:DNA ligase [Paucibacter sp. DJ2R-2]|uniref:DNA ligase n=1 Tax=Paucibacter sp. DJ2R-2 TaxID=2893558 RepID=UPI0021E405D3|nr:DNA ligase [Paucibacter sp. DJ2R-2]MCV2420687.1 DNA ligase [Paucibacter sp. DJ4R-1]MCV2439886.1 DNA ligase [Paucibacter sp. DJ2R-2]
MPRRRLLQLGSALFSAGALGAAALATAAVAKPPLLLAQTPRGGLEGLDLSRYLVSEKFDGVRAYWTGDRLLSRQGLALAAPASVLERLPLQQPLDGELWMGRGRFEACSAALQRSQPREEEWLQIQYLLFELPGGAGPFSRRVVQLREIATAVDTPMLRVVPQEQVGSLAELRQRLQAVLRAGGEGLMLHEADAPYISGRHEALLKLKAHDDEAAVVIAHLPGQGRLSGLLGALRVRNAAGQEFNLGSGFSEAQRRAPPPLGSTVSYRYRGLTGSGLPRFATFLRVQDL